MKRQTFLASGAAAAGATTPPNSSEKSVKVPTGVLQWPTSGKTPVVFTFQPVGYSVVAPSRLQEWEAALRDRVGFPAHLAAAIAKAGLSYSNTYSTVFDD